MTSAFSLTMLIQRGNQIQILFPQHSAVTVFGNLGGDYNCKRQGDICLAERTKKETDQPGEVDLDA